MTHYILRRIALMPLYFFVFSFLVFFITMYAPGDPAQLIAGRGASDETIEQVRKDYGFDRPVIVQYGDYMGRFAHGDFGESLRFRGKEIKDLILERLPISAPLGLAAVIIAIVAGTAIGLWATFSNGTWVDKVLLSGSLFFAVIPSLILVQVMILVLALQLQLLPAGWTGGWKSVFSANAIIPVLTMALPSIAGFARFVRTITLNIVDQPYVRAARARGVAQHTLALRYVLRNAMLFYLTVVIPALFAYIEGSFFVESIYGIPGLSVFLIDSVFGRDYPVIIFMGIVGSMLAIMIMLLQDVLYRVADPRVNVAK